MSINSGELKKTSLYQIHKNLGAKLAPFAGWEMPIQFDGVISEHTWTRNSAGLFDVSHMAIFELLTKEAFEAFTFLIPSNISNLEVGRQKYSVLTNEAGGVIDDFMITHIDEETYRVVSNASRRDEVRSHLLNHLPEGSFVERLDLTMIALQGPSSAEVLSNLGFEVGDLVFLDYRSEKTNFGRFEITRSGYTGEDGFEIILDQSQSEYWVEELLSSAQVRPVGLGARDTLRLEAGLSLYGNDLNETITPISAGLDWVIDKQKLAENKCLGASKILSDIEGSPKYQRVGIKPEGKRPVRDGSVLYTTSGDEIGYVSSGGYGPTIEGPVSMGYVHRDHLDYSTSLYAEVRGKKISCYLHELPFVKHNYFRGK